MSNDEYLSRTKAARDTAKNGVDYSPRLGAVCPFCSTPRARVATSLPWDGDCKVRYHICGNADCPLQQLGITIKSVEVDTVAAPAQA